MGGLYEGAAGAALDEYRLIRSCNPPDQRNGAGWTLHRCMQYENLGAVAARRMVFVLASLLLSVPA
jgi:hypothetical protein